MKNAPDDLGFRPTANTDLPLFGYPADSGEKSDLIGKDGRGWIVADAVSARTTPNATRKLAQEQAEREGQKNRRLLLAAIKEHGPMTADEAGAKVGLGPLQARPRVSQLGTLGDLLDTGEKRPSSQGNPMTVWRAK